MYELARLPDLRSASLQSVSRDHTTAQGLVLTKLTICLVDCRLGCLLDALSTQNRAGLRRKAEMDDDPSDLVSPERAREPARPSYAPGGRV